MTATITRIRAGAPAPADQRQACRRAKDTGFHAPIDTITEPFAFAGDPGDEMQGFGGSGVVWIVSLAVLLPMAVWGVVAAVRFFIQS